MEAKSQNAMKIQLKRLPQAGRARHSVRAVLGSGGQGTARPTDTRCLLLAVTFLIASAFNSFAGIITTYAGGGTNGNFSNMIGFPATNACFPAFQKIAAWNCRLAGLQKLPAANPPQ
jgi:hypothetical protein